MLLLGAIGTLAGCEQQPQKSVSVAVAANFTEPAKEVGRLFQQKTGHTAVMSFGSTGQLFTQITQDAPFEVFLSADQETPRKAISDGLAVEASLFTYAIGRIVLYSSSLDLTDGEDILREGKFGKIAVANPSTAPYGAAAIEAMKSLGVYEKLERKIVQGNNISQAYQFVGTGNAELGFVALSQVIGRDPTLMWIVPDTLYSPIRQDAVLLKKGNGNAVAQAFLEFLKSPDALAVVEKYGYYHSP